MIAGLVALGVVLFFGALLFVPMRFGVRFKKTARGKKFHVYVSVFGILIRIPIHTMKDDGNKANKNDKEQRGILRRADWSVDSFCARVDALSNLFSESKQELKSLLSYVRKHLRCSEIDLNIRFGLDNAAKTGIANGAVWTSGTLLLKLVDALIGTKKVKMQVYPDFNEKKFELYVKTILIMQPIHFIMIAKKISETINFIKIKLN